uniref:Uncharacterized protein n=1 Tax=Arundo donax TaxID=35708 RepID=A0A0A9GED3_ARUDO
MVDDYGSGTDTVQEKFRTHGREVKTCPEENLIEVSDQNFSEEEVGANDEPCKKRRPTSSIRDDQPM